jgi:hypothetical protein
MTENNDYEARGAWSAVIIVAAMLIGALASEVLEGIPQVVVLAACLTAMCSGVITDMMRHFRG